MKKMPSLILPRSRMGDSPEKAEKGKDAEKRDMRHSVSYSKNAFRPDSARNPLELGQDTDRINDKSHEKPSKNHEKSHLSDGVAGDENKELDLPEGLNTEKKLGKKEQVQRE